MEKQQVEVIIENPPIDMWNRSYTQILEDIPGDHSGLTPITVINKYFFDYEEDEYDDDESLFENYHWSSRDYKSLCNKVTKRLGSEYVSLIEPKLVMICSKN